MYNSDRSSLRGTGRTSRMIEDAIYEAMHGRRVFVVVEPSDLAQNLLDRAIDEVGPENVDTTFRDSLKAVQLRGQGSIQFLAPNDPSINWESLRIAGSDRPEILLIDHHVIETRFRTALEMLHRWDPRPAEDQGPHEPGPDPQ